MEHGRFSAELAKDVHYLLGAQIYLQDILLFRKSLKTEHAKYRLLGHWGTRPGRTPKDPVHPTPNGPGSRALRREP